MQSLQSSPLPPLGTLCLCCSCVAAHRYAPEAQPQTCNLAPSKSDRFTPVFVCLWQNMYYGEDTVKGEPTATSLLKRGFFVTKQPLSHNCNIG